VTHVCTAGEDLVSEQTHETEESLSQVAGWLLYVGQRRSQLLRHGISGRR